MAIAIADQSVLTPAKVNENMKKALATLNPGVDIDINTNPFTEEELGLINSTDSDRLVEVFTDEQLKYYNSLKESLKDVYLEGWKNRLDRLNDYEE